MNKNVLLALTGSACLSLSAFAGDMHAKLDGTLDIQIKPRTQAKGFLNQAPLGFKVMKLKLSGKAKQTLAHRAANRHAFAATAQHPNLPASVNLTMNNVPVLNQGMHGSCVTFANAGAIDAVLGKGDYVSALCNLTLGNYLEKNGYVPSGWDGSWGPIVLNQIMSYGIVSKANESGCGGLSSYPTNNQWETGGPTSLNEYHDKSENVSFNLAWSPLVSTEDVFHDEYDPSTIVDQVKVALNNKHRVTFGVLLDVYVGEAGAVGKYKSKWGFDTWMMTPQIEDDLKNGDVNAGHEILIYGYDDNAVVTDEEGNQQKGIFIIRNSWSKNAGDNGDYYMTYDYFRTMTMEAQKILADKSANND